MNLIKKYRFFLLWVEALLLIIGHAGRIEINSGINFYVLEAVIALHTLILIATNNIRAHIPIKFAANKIAQSTLVWFILLGTVLLWQTPQYSSIQNIRAWSYLARLINFAVFAFLVLPYVKQIWLEKVTALLCFLIPLVALFQYFLLPDLRFLATYGWDPHMYRAVGTIFDPPIIGSVVGMLFAFVVYRLVIRSSGSLSIIGKSANYYIYAPLYIFCGETFKFLLIFFTIIFLYSRSTYLAVLFVTNYIFWRYRKYFFGLVFSIIFILSIYYAPKTIPAYERLESAKIERMSTVTSRKTEIVSGLQAFIRNPIWGIGYNRIKEYKSRLTVESRQSKAEKDEKMRNSNPKIGSSDMVNHAGSAFHSFWVTQLAATGILGFGLLLWIFAELVRKNPPFIYILSVPSFIGLFDNTLFHPFVLFTLVILYFVISKRHAVSVTN